MESRRARWPFLMAFLFLAGSERQFIDIEPETSTSRNWRTDITNRIAHVVLVDPMPTCPRQSFQGPTPHLRHGNCGTLPVLYCIADADVTRTLFRTFFRTKGSIWREEIAMFSCRQI